MAQQQEPCGARLAALAGSSALEPACCCLPETPHVGAKGHISLAPDPAVSGSCQSLGEHESSVKAHCMPPMRLLHTEPDCQLGASQRRHMKDPFPMAQAPGMKGRTEGHRAGLGAQQRGAALDLTTAGTFISPV